jgi:type III secretion protein J
MPSAAFSSLRAVLAGVLMALCSLLAACGRTELFNSLDETDANAVQDTLYQEGIQGWKQASPGGGWSVEVSSDDHARALRVTRQQGVPHERFANLGQLFKKEGLVSSPSEDRLRYIFAVSQELAATLSQIDGVIAARVHPVIPFNDPLATTVRPASAAVFIKHKPNADIQQMAPAIRGLVVRSIEGLAPDNVSLTFVAASPAFLSMPAAVDNSVSGRFTSVEALSLLLLGAALPTFIGLGLYFHRRQQPRRLMPRLAADVRADDMVVVRQESATV